MQKQDKKFDHITGMIHTKKPSSFTHKDISTAERWMESANNLSMVKRSPWSCNHTFEKEEIEKKGSCYKTKYLNSNC